MGDNDTKDTYEADDSILNPSGKGEHTEVTETKEDGTEKTAATARLVSAPPMRVAISLQMLLTC